MKTKYLFQFRSFWVISYRFQSKGSDQQKVEAIKRLNRENKLQFGNLIETASSRTKKKRIINTSKNESYVNKKESEKEHDNRQVTTNNIAVDAGSENNSRLSHEKSESEECNEIDNEVSESAIENPFAASPFFNKLKQPYTPNLIYNQIKSIHPNYFPYPSVSHILSESMSPLSEINLKKWKESLVSEMGDDEFQIYSHSLMHSAKSLRKLVLLRLRGIPEEKLEITPELLGCWESLKNVFLLFPEVKEIGKVVVHPELKYKGMVDSLVLFRNKIVLVSWKKANKYVPSLDKTYDLPIQCAAYMGAINFDVSFPFSVDEALIVMSYTNGMKADIFHLNTDKCQHYWKLWLERLNTYRIRTKKNKTDETLEKLNLEEELAKMSENKINMKTINIQAVEPDSSKYEILVPPKAELVTSFPLSNDEKVAYSPGQKFELAEMNQISFSSCPAVTTILSETKSASAKFLLDRWKNKLIAELGVEGFETYHRNILATGVSFHKLIQNHLEGTLEDIPSELAGCWDSLREVFPLITEVKLTESKVVHEKLQYKGIIDCVAEYRGKLVVIDWKKSDKLKSTINLTYDSPVQIAAYIGAVNFDSNYPFKVEEGLLVISYTNGSKADVYHLDAGNCRKYWELWLKRLHKYQIEINSNCQKINY